MTVSNVHRKEDHPWDAMLRVHVEEVHADAIVDIVENIFEEAPPERRVWDVYKEAIAVRERQKFPEVGVSVDRRTFEYTCAVFNDATIR